MRQTRHPRGGALISALIAVIVVASMTMGLTQLTMTSNGVCLDTADRYNALLLAESGMAMAFQQIDASIFNDSPIPVFEGANLEVTGTEPGIVYFKKIDEHHEIVVVKRKNKDGLPMLEATGKVQKRMVLGNVTRCYRTLQAVLDVTSADGGFVAGAFGLVGMSLTGSFMSDSYNAKDGSYATTKGHDGDVGTNGKIDKGNSNSLSIDGSVYTGPGQPLFVNNGVTGGSYNLPALISVNIVPYAPTVPVSATLPDSIGAGDYHVASLSKNNTLVITGGVVNIFVDGSMSLGDIKLQDQNTKLNIYQNSGTITINGGGALNTAVTYHHPASTVPAGSVVTAPIVRTINNGQNGVTAASQAFLSTSDTYTTQKHGNTVLGWTITTPATATLTAPYAIPAWDETAEGIPSNFNIISHTTQQVTINGNSTFFGTLLAPYAPVKVNGTAAKYGAVLGSYLDMAGTGDFHNDTSAKSPGYVNLPVIRSYCEILSVVPPKD